MQLLAGWTATPVGQLPAEAAQVAQECGYLPLALALCGAMIAAGDHSWPQLLDLLRHADLEALHSRLVDYPHRSLAVALGASIDTLPPDARGRYMRLAVFDAEGPVPPAALQVLWGLDRQDTAALIDDLAAKSLLRVEANQVSLHDLQMDYLVRRAAASLPALHNQLLAAYSEQCHGGWASGPDDGYFYQHLAHHLHHAGRLPELQALLLDLDWMNAKLTTGNIPGLLADYDSLPSDPALRLVAGALRLSAHVLADDPGQLPSQLTGRLASQHDPQLRDLLQRTRRWPANPWLRPLTASLTPPGGPLLRTLTGHDGEVDGGGGQRGRPPRGLRRQRRDGAGVGPGHRRAAAHPDRPPWRGRWRWRSARTAAARSPAATTGRCGCGTWTPAWPLHTLTGHDGEVAGGGGQRGRPPRGLRRRRRDGAGVGPRHRRAAAHPDRPRRRGGWRWRSARTAAARSPAASDGTVRVWDLDTGAPLHALTGHHGGVRCGGGQRGRPPRGLRRQRRDGAGVGPGHRCAAAHPDRPPRWGRGGGGQRGRPPCGLRRQRRDGAGVGPRHRCSCCTP